MRHKEFDKSRVVKYLVWTFALAYLIQFGVGLLYQRGNMMIGQLVMAGMMVVPMLGVLLSGGKLSGMGWRLQIKKNIKAILIGWFVPAVLTAIGAALYFIIFPGHFDLSGSSMGPDALEQLQVQGISYPMYVLISLVSSLTYAPLLNTFVSLGEEIGWRGFLYPQLRAKLGREKGWLLGGIIWGAWHWPLIGLIGYEYGTEYFGFPVVGMLVFCVFTIAMGILCDWLYEQSGSIWVPSICHGAINAAGTLPLAICLPNTGSARLLGPMPNGLIAGLPILITAVLLGRKEPSTENS